MPDFDDENRTTLERVIADLHRETGEVIVDMSRDVGSIPDDVSRLFHSPYGWNTFPTIASNKSRALDYPDLIERAAALIEEATTIWLEKGYRYMGALITAQEHKDRGSSGYEEYLAMPDTVVQIVKKRWGRTDDGIGPMTIEEIRRARILAGLPSIDDTGTVTGEQVPIANSYHFLSFKRAGEINQLEQKIVEGLKDVAYEAIARKVADFVRYEAIVREMASGEISRPEAYKQMEPLGMPADIADRARRIFYMEEGGKADSMLTPMEITILGRTVEERHRETPYTPLGIQKGNASIEQVNAWRGEEKFLEVYTDMFSGFSRPTGLTLEPLNAGGQTERGPQILLKEYEGRGAKYNEIASGKWIELWKQHSKPVPFSRPGDWYHKPAA